MTRRIVTAGYRTLLLMLYLLLTGPSVIIAQTAERYSFNFQNDPLDRALYLISQNTEADIIYESHLTEGVRVTAHFQDESMDQILFHLLRPSGLEARRIRTGMYVLRYALRREMEPVAQISVNGKDRITKLRNVNRVNSDRPPGPLRERTIF